MATNTNRRYKVGFLWVGLINVSYFLCLFKGMDLSWWVEYAKAMTYWFGILVLGLSATDIAGHVKDIFNRNNGGTK